MGRQPAPALVDRERIIAFLTSERRPLSFKEIVTRMNLSSPASRACKKVLRRLVKDGEVVRTKRGTYGLVQELSLEPGVFEAHRDGYGFVILDKPGTADVFVPARSTHSAMDGDRVVVQVEEAASRAGRIVRVLDRARSRVAGVVEFFEGTCFVRPKGRGAAFTILVPARHLPEGVVDGQLVVVEITEFPDGPKPATGRIVTVVERPTEPAEEVGAVMDEYSLPKRFPPGVSSAASALADRPFGQRRDMRDQLVVTIDGETARDFDDAVAIERDGTGYVLYVHIADVSHYVDEGGVVDMEARRRATSVYFPDRVIPMLPKALSEELCSLRPGEDRPVMTVEMRLDARGVVTGAEFYPALIRSSERMTYTAVAGIIEHHDEAVMERYAPLVYTFVTMEELAMLLRAQRLNRGSLDFDLPEPEVMLDATGRPEAILKAERNRAHMLIEDFMIAANEAVAGHLEGAGAACVYRIHEEPDSGKVDTLLGMARLMLRLPPSRRPKNLHGLVKAVKGSDVEDVIMFQALRSMKQARYSTENVGHYGLASECYCHFTSPIRRYPDLIVHRLLKATLAGSGGLHERNLEELAYHCSTMERASMEAERSVLAALRVWFMRERLGQELPGRVVGVGTWGLRVRLDEFFVDGSVDMVSLSDDYYVYDEDTVTLRGRHGGRTFRLGQKLKVRVDRANPEDRTVWFGLVGMMPGRIRTGRAKLNTGGGRGGQRPKTRRRRR